MIDFMTSWLVKANYHECMLIMASCIMSACLSWQVERSVQENIKKRKLLQLVIVKIILMH